MLFDTSENKPIEPLPDTPDVVFLELKDSFNKLIPTKKFDDYQHIVIVHAKGMTLNDIQLSTDKYKFLIDKRANMNKFLWSNSIEFGVADVYKSIQSKPIADVNMLIKEDLSSIYESGDRVKIIRLKNHIINQIETIFEHYKALSTATLFVVVSDIVETGRSYKYSSLSLRSKINKVVEKTSQFSVTYVDSKHLYNVDHSGVVNTGTLASFKNCFMLFYSKFTLTIHNDNNHVCYLSSAKINLDGSKCGSLLKVNFTDDSSCKAQNIVMEMELTTNNREWKCNSVTFKFNYKNEPVVVSDNCIGIGAPYTFSQTCNKYTFNLTNKYTAVINYFQLQNSYAKPLKFKTAVDCSPMFTIDILNGLLVAIVLGLIVAWGLSTLFGIRANTTIEQPSEMIELGKN